MIQIVYIRSALAPWSTEHARMLQQCLKNSSARGVTGMLLYGEGTFLQALEGDDLVIDDLIERIARDPRHANVQFLHRRPIERRQYSDWSMGFKRSRAATSRSPPWCWRALPMPAGPAP